MKITTKTTVLSLTAALILTSFAVAQGGRHAHRGDAGDGQNPRTGEVRTGDARGGEGRGAFRERMRERFQRREALRKFVRSMEFTDAQRAQALQSAKVVAPIAESARAEARAIVENARKAKPDATRAERRELVKPQLQALKERTASQILPQGQALLGSLTAEQRAKLVAAAEKHGRTFDEQRAARRLAFLLSRPKAVAFLEARVRQVETGTR